MMHGLTLTLDDVLLMLKPGPSGFRLFLGFVISVTFNPDAINYYHSTACYQATDVQLTKQERIIKCFEGTQLLFQLNPYILALRLIYLETEIENLSWR